MPRHRNPRQRLTKPQPPDNRHAALPDPDPEPDGLDCLLDTLRDQLRRADAMVSTAERQIEENWHDDEGDAEELDAVLRHRMRIEYLVEAGKFAVREALYTAQQIDAVIAAHKRGA